MTQAREKLVSLSDTPYYHIVSRCVRRTFLCGTDAVSGVNYEHRRQWIEERIRILSSIFTIDIGAYAVMSNHYHIVLKLCPEQANDWTMQEVFERWCCLFKGPLLVQYFLKGKALSSGQLATLKEFESLFRKRLCDLSWFMKCLNEPIARMANQEDECTGHFWEARFKSQALLSEAALLSCMTYVDLNPIRANMAATPEASEHTSIKERLKPTFNRESATHSLQAQGCLFNFRLSVKPLLDFEGNTNNRVQAGILFEMKDYLQLVDTTGRMLHPNKQGLIIERFPPILQRLGFDQSAWLKHVSQFEEIYESCYSRLSEYRRLNRA